MKFRLAICSFLMSLMPLQAYGGIVYHDLREKMRDLGPNEEIPVIINLMDKADVSLIRDRDKRTRRSKIIRGLKEKADSTQKPLHAFLQKSGVKKIKPLWIKNAIAVTAPLPLIKKLENFPGIESIELDAVIPAPVPTYGTAAAPEWNISAIHAPALWNLGFTGTGVVVASMDTGVDVDHPDLVGSWRGGANSWYDPHGEHTDPHDANGHGTQVLGIIVGGDAGGSAIGIAPGAQWISVKIYNDANVTTNSIIHQGFQWLLDPDDNPDTDDAPDVVNNSWGFDQQPGQCNIEFQPDIQALKMSEIAVVFSAGNSGPNASTSVSPANNPESFAVGAVHQTLVIELSSSRGPSACGGDVFPEVVAPGVNIRTADLTLFPGNPDPYAYVNGTSFAAPHVAGAMALLLSAFPSLTVSQLESAIENSALDLGTPGPDNDYGYGLINLLKTYKFFVPDKITIFKSGQWYLDMNGDGAWNPAEDRFYGDFGIEGAIPVTGDWDGTGTTRIGIYYNGTWYLDMNGNGAWDPAEDRFYGDFGIAGAIPVTGDWDGTGTTRIGIYYNGQWYLDLNGNGTWEGPSIDRFNGDFGTPGAIPVTGNWDGTGTTRIGIYYNGTWYLDLNGNGAWDGTPTDALYPDFGVTGSISVTGDWNGTGTSKIGIYYNGAWYLDLNGNGAWEGKPTDTFYGDFGLAGASPVTGKW